MKNELPLIYEKNIGVKCFSMQFFINVMIKENKLKAFSTPDGKFTFKENELQLVDRIDERMPYILKYKKIKSNYTLVLESYSNGSYEDGTMQTLHYKCTLNMLKESLPSQLEITDRGLRFQVLDNNLQAKLIMSYSDSWVSDGKKDKIVSSSANTKIFGEKDKFFEQLVKYLEKE